MNNIVSWLTKRKVIFISLVGVIVFILSYFSKDLGICPRGVTYCSDYSKYFAVYSLPFVSVFIFSLVTFRLTETTFYLWKNFSVWAIPVSLIIITFLPMRTHGLDFVPILKGNTIFFLTILYSIISLILIFYKSLKKE